MTAAIVASALTAFFLLFSVFSSVCRRVAILVIKFVTSVIVRLIGVVAPIGDHGTGPPAAGALMWLALPVAKETTLGGVAGDTPGAPTKALPVAPDAIMVFGS